YKYRFYPTLEQAAELTRTFGCVRKVWNLAVQARTTAWNQRHERVTYLQSSALPRRRPARQAGAWRRACRSASASGNARTAVPGTTGISTPRSTSKPPGWRCLPAELAEDPSGSLPGRAAGGETGTPAGDRRNPRPLGRREVNGPPSPQVTGRRRRTARRFPWCSGRASRRV